MLPFVQMFVYGKKDPAPPPIKKIASSDTCIFVLMKDRDVIWERFTGIWSVRC